jgi:hypothetical protein
LATGDDQIDSALECVPARTFGLVWDTLNDMMGSAATATLVRRALKHAARGSPELGEIAITRDRFAYRHVLPSSWHTDSPAAMAGLRGLTKELEPLLFELTGAVVLRRLRNEPELTRAGLFAPEVES